MLALLVSSTTAAWFVAAVAAAADDLKPPGPGTPSAPATKSAAAARPEPPASPRKYLEAGARLFNAGRFELSSKYLQAAQMYRDRLSASERVVLEVYQEKLDHYLEARATEGNAPAPAAPQGMAGNQPTVDGRVKPTSTDVRPLEARVIDPVQALARRPDEDDLPNLADPSTWPTVEPGADPKPAAGPPERAPSALGASVSWRDTTDAKQKARWLLQLAREQVLKEHFDVAQQAIDEARALDVEWSLFDETPDRLSDALTKARAKAGPKSTDPTRTRDRRMAKARLKEARGALEANDVERAEQILRDVRTWGVSYGLFDDTPEKLASAIFETRRREAVRNAELMVRSYYRDGRDAPVDPPVQRSALPPADEAPPRSRD